VKPDHWDLATSAEAALATGNITAARRDYQRFVEHADVDAFALTSSLRQLNEVWRISGGSESKRNLVQLLSSKLLKLRGGEVELSSQEIRQQLNLNSGNYEKIYGVAATVTLDWYKKGLTRCENIARIGIDPTRGIGTGFLIKGEVLHTQWQGKTVLITNAHVVSNDPTDEATSHLDAVAYFELRGGIQSRFTEILWHSKKTELDITVLALEKELAIDTNFPIARSMPKNNPESQIYVIGHPNGGTLAFSLQDNELINYDNSHIWYRTPTEGGSSGSPIFNSQWELIGVHHKGGASSAPLASGEVINANEGVQWSSIINSIFKQ